MRRLLPSVLLGTSLWLAFQWTVHPHFKPVEVSLDLSHMETQPSLRGQWQIVPSGTFRGIMDIYLAGANASVVFDVPQMDTYWLRVKARFLRKDQTLSTTLNGHPLAEFASAQTRLAQKFALKVSSEFFVPGTNEVTFGTNNALPVAVEKIDLRNYRSRTKGVPIFVGFDRSNFGRNWARLRWETVWMLLLLMVGVFWMDVGIRRAWSAVPGLPGWQPALIANASRAAPLLIPLGLITGSLVTEYVLTVGPWAFWSFCAGSILAAQLIGVPIAAAWAWNLFWKLPAVQEIVLLAVHPEQIPLRLSAKIRVLYRIALIAAPQCWAWIRISWYKAMSDPWRWYAAFVIGTATAGLLLILQSSVYLFELKQDGKIVDAHGAYPWLRKAAETTGDLGMLALLGFMLCLFMKNGSVRTGHPDE
ncbi:MAG: hypothetical protein HY594_01770 [Candidatus Omnitrophica bacterium]|nr:hypothetical protein [Candidatus Omnitrophota bacterium]